MKTWKRWTALLMALLCVAAMAACGSEEPVNTESAPTVATQPTEQTELPTEQTEPTEQVTVPETTLDMSIYSAFLGTWYEGGSDVAGRLTLDENRNWRYTDKDEELLLNGYFQMVDETTVDLYNNDVELVMTMKLNEDGTVYMELLLDVAFNLIQTTDFSKEVTNSDVLGNDILDDGGSDIVEEPIPEDDVSAQDVA